MSQSYVTPSQKTFLQDQFFNLHDTFARPITMFKTAKSVVITTNPDNNVYFPDAPTNDQTTETIISGCFNARIKYNPKQDLAFASTFRGADDQITLKTMEGVVRLKLDMTGAAYLADTRKVRFDGNIYEVFSDNRPHGLFTPNFETFYLKRDN